MSSHFINNLFKKSDCGFFALIDPDLKNDYILDKIISTVNDNNFSAVLVGGSSICDDKYEKRLEKIKRKVKKPVILFPGSSNQITQFADAILFTSLLSGRNPKYLIDEQVKGVKLIKKYNLPVISTGYFLLGTESKTSVEKISETVPLDPLDFENVLNHVLVAQYFGMNSIYLENGSGAGNPVDYNLVEFLSNNIEIPMIVGGGIQNKDDIINIKKAGARFIVLGTILEENPDSVFISKLLS
tara:strand:- start:705 stop:1430 length:726 start_codon:yes stop_codon:yes gene_type:complete